MSKRKYAYWTVEEKELIKSMYEKVGAIGIHDLLPHRSRGAIMCFARKIGVRVGPYLIGRHPNSHGNRKKYPAGISGKMEVLKDTKRGARERNHEFNLSDDYFYSLIKEPCHYCGDIDTVQHGRGWGAYKSNGVDRVDNEKGYIYGNVVACCGKCNKMKMTLSKDDFIEQAKKIAIHAGKLAEVYYE